MAGLSGFGSRRFASRGSRGGQRGGRRCGECGCGVRRSDGARSCGGYGRDCAPASDRRDGRIPDRGAGGRARRVYGGERGDDGAFLDARRTDHGRDAQGLYQVRTPRSARPTDRADGPCERPVRHVVLCEERSEQRQGQYDGLRLPRRTRGDGRRCPACDDASCGGGERMARIRVPYI